MNLTIDIGNNFTKTLVFFDTAPVYRNVSRGLTSSYIDRLTRKFSIEKTMVSSVVDLKKPAMSLLKRLPHFELLNHRTSIPIKNLYSTPHTLGNDRLANAIAGSFLFPEKNVLIIDVGTCIKYDFVNAGKEYLGGNISPGMNMRFKAMNEFTGKLPLVKPAAIKTLIGKSTMEAMQSGVMIGMADEISGFIERYKKNYKSLKVILTGGDARRFAGDLKLSIFAAEDLVNIGLNEIIRFNRSKR